MKQIQNRERLSSIYRFILFIFGCIQEKKFIRWILSYLWNLLLQYSSNFFFNSWFSLKIFLNLKLSFKVVYDNFLNTNTRNKKEHAKTNPTETHTSYDTRSLLKENPFALLSSFNSSLLGFVLEWRKCLMLLSQRNGKQISFQYQIRPQRPAVKVISINLWRW